MELEDTLDRYQLAKLQDDLIGLTIRFKRDFPMVQFKESTIYSDIVSYLNIKLIYHSFDELEHTAYYHLMELYGVKP